MNRKKEPTLADEFKRFAAELLSDEKRARKFLIDAGIHDKHGKLTKRYRN